MHPARRVGQALHAVEVGYVVPVGLGEVGAEVGIAYPQMTSVGAEIGRSFAKASTLPRVASSKGSRARARIPESVRYVLTDARAAAVWIGRWGGGFFGLVESR